MDKYELALRTASAIYYLGGDSLSMSEEWALQNNTEFRERVERYLRRMRNGETIRKPREGRLVILDCADMQYRNLLIDLRHQYEHVHIYFLCGYVNESSHFASIYLTEFSITYQCLNIPRDEWKEWKKHPAYQGS